MAAFVKRFLFTVLFGRKSTSSSGTRNLWRRMRDAKFPSGSPSRPSQQRRTTIKPPIRDGPNLRVVSRLQTFQNQWTSLVVTITRMKSRRCYCVTRNAVDLKNPASRKPTKATATSKLMGRKTQLKIVIMYIADSFFFLITNLGTVNFSFAFESGLNLFFKTLVNVYNIKNGFF